MQIEVSTKNMKFLEAFSSETRIKIIEMLNSEPMNIKDIALKLGISSAIVTKHIQKLEAAGIVKSDNMSGKRGMQKICSLNLEQAVLRFRQKSGDDNTYNHSIPVGQYNRFNIKPICGLASTEKQIGIVDDPRYFADPEHVHAALIWFASGWVEYRIPNYLLSTQEIKYIELSLEVCSEAPGYNEIWPSDISFRLNDISVGMWTCPGDFGKSRGIFTPEWWKGKSQHGLLKTLLVNKNGSFIDGVKISNVKVSDLQIGYGEEITFRIASNEGAKNPGGINIFGKGFGNYDQDINIIIGY